MITIVSVVCLHSYKQFCADVRSTRVICSIYRETLKAAPNRMYLLLYFVQKICHWKFRIVLDFCW